MDGGCGRESPFFLKINVPPRTLHEKLFHVENELIHKFLIYVNQFGKPHHSMSEACNMKGIEKKKLEFFSTSEHVRSSVGKEESEAVVCCLTVTSFSKALTMN